MFAKLFPGNLSGTDRAIRIGLGIALLLLAFFGPKTAWGYVGLVPLLTALAGTCPLYALFGISSCPVRTPMT